jgi:site-specific DNA-cytosine methylase
MKVLLACEESQAVCKEFRRLGHEAYSCDIQECSGGHPEWHIQGDVLPLLQQEWDLIIAFPPCTHLSVSGAKHFAKKREDGRQRQAIEFFMQFINAPCDKIAVENPVNIISGGGTSKNTSLIWLPNITCLSKALRKFSRGNTEIKHKRQRACG